jgi:hypothetical protein
VFGGTPNVDKFKLVVDIATDSDLIGVTITGYRPTGVSPRVGSLNRRRKMPTVDTNRLKGNFGAAFVSACLSSERLVRPVAAETDVGIDLYCETIENGSPFLHFGSK